jgi:hypothetical protein
MTRSVVNDVKATETIQNDEEIEKSAVFSLRFKLEVLFAKQNIVN